tara:strand:+ start:945 stop:1547 length:603 start_codon:yes stop_codon:yes gene_type:complete
MNNENEKVLSEDGPDHKKLLVKLTEYQGHHLFELRYYYFDKKANDFKPTRKGVMLTRTNYLTVKKVIDKYHEKTMDWLGLGYVEDSTSRHEREQEIAVEKAKYKLTDYGYGYVDNSKNPNCFEVKFEGGKSSVFFNNTHPMTKKIQELESSGDAGKQAVSLIADIFLAYSSARVHHSDSPSSHPDILLDSLEYDWSKILK